MVMMTAYNAISVTDENCEELEQSNKGAMMTCPFEEPLEDQHTDERDIALFFVPFAEYIGGFYHE